MATASPDKKGMKRICPSCSTRYYDFNKRPVSCPNCKTEFTGEIKARARRRPANDIIEDEGQVSEATASKKVAGGDDEEDELLEGDEGVVSLEDIDEDDDVDEDEEEGDPDLELDEDDLDDEDDDDDDDDGDDDEDENEDEDEDGKTPSKPSKTKKK